MYFNMVIGGVVTRQPERLERPANDWSCSMDVVVQTGFRGGKPHYEHFYVLLKDGQADLYPSSDDGACTAEIITSAFWTFATQDLSGNPVTGLACTAGKISFSPRKVQP
jgi:hypothetical protein